MELDRSIYFAMQLRAWDQIDLSILAIPIWVPVQHVKKKKKLYRYRSLCALVHGSVLPVPVLCLRILPMVRDKSIVWQALGGDKYI